MNATHIYYYLQPSTMNPCNATLEERKRIRNTWKCPGCTLPKPDFGAIDITIAQTKIRDEPLNFVTDGVDLALMSFLDQMGQDVVSRDLLLGNVFGPDGKLNEEWVTYRGRYSVVIRGENDITTRKCESCGRRFYGSKGEQYLYPAPPSEANVFEYYGMGMVVTERIFNRLEIPPKSKIAVTRLEVIDPPLDGLGLLE